MVKNYLIAAPKSTQQIALVLYNTNCSRDMHHIEDTHTRAARCSLNECAETKN